MIPSCLIVGIGNPQRGDDGAGPLAAEILRDRLPSGVKIEIIWGEPASLVEWLERADCAWLIDAAASAEPAGKIRRFDLSAGAVPERSVSVSTHGFGLSETLELVRALGALPPCCIVYSIDGKSFDDGMPLSPEVSAAVQEVTDRISGELQRFVKQEGQ